MNSGTLEIVPSYASTEGSDWDFVAIPAPEVDSVFPLGCPLLYVSPASLVPSTLKLFTALPSSGGSPPALVLGCSWGFYFASGPS